MTMQRNRTSPTNPHTSSSAFAALAWVGGFGLVCVFAYSFHASNWVSFLSVAASGLMTAVAAASVGGLLGFLFGIPRTLQAGEPHDAGDPRHENGTAAAYLPNTNLEQISDWLTKILVGVGLTQITAISAWFATVSSVAAAGLGGSDAGRVVASTMIVFFAVCGFLFGFLWTRLHLPRALHDADLGVLAARLRDTADEVKQVKDKLDRQAKADATALSLIQRQINPAADGSAVAQEDLDAAVESASLPVKVTIFNQAQNARSKHWKDPATKPMMERTIPIFRALIAADAENRFHKNHGQLGFALKDKSVPDWKAAEAELTRAIEMRRDDQQDGWLFYEFCRAQCRINLDANYVAGQPSASDFQALVLEDLQAAAAGGLRSIVLTDPDVDKWLKLNNLTV